jgi:hypothetical protein
MRETPTITSSNLSSACTAIGLNQSPLQGLHQPQTLTTTGTAVQNIPWQGDYAKELRQKEEAILLRYRQERLMASPSRRLVQVIIIDPNDNVSYTVDGLAPPCRMIN